MAGYLLFTLLMALNVISINVNGVHDSDKRAGLLQYFRSLLSVVDVVCLQECHSSSDSECQMWFHSSGFFFCCVPWLCQVLWLHNILSSFVVPC